MRNIQKQTEPRSLTEHKCQPHADYDNYAEKDDLRRSLVEEQRGICCYCMKRIQSSSASMKIEHWRAQSADKYPELQLEYSNLLGACCGGEGQRKQDQHCDTRKGNDDLRYNPADPAHDVERLFSFPGSGRIEVRGNDSALQAELDNVLNLNHSLLVRNRKSVIDAFKTSLGRRNMSKADFQRELRKWNGSDGGELAQYCQVVVYYLKKKLKIP